MISRRGLIKTLLVMAAAYPRKKAMAAGKSERFLSLYNIHTKESLETSYYSSGGYDHGALGKINHLLRCHYTDEVKAIDVRVLDLLCDIKDMWGKGRPVHIISGFRSPAYNAYLINNGRRVAGNSFHLCGLAVDFAIPGLRNDEISLVAKSFVAGGVGKYPEFVHIDVGPVRY